MLDHISLRVSDFDRALAFYTAALGPLGYAVVMRFPGAAGIGPKGKPEFWITASDKPINPTHVAFSADRPTVDAFHAAALAAGGRDNGKPGLRKHYHPNYYGAFVLDPDGNNIEACCHLPPGREKAPARGRGKAKAKAKAKAKSVKRPTARKAAAKKAAKPRAAKRSALGAKKAAPKKTSRKGKK